jgi:predicted glutamine amidotransferase
VCELFCLSGRLPTRATLSLETFARHGGYNGNAVDGWGIAFFDGRDVRLYKEPEPASDSAWLDFVEQRRLPSRLILSHIRHATQGCISLANTQPFLRELGGRSHVFAHNGQLGGIANGAAGERRRFRPLGETDSEIAFCLLLEQIAPLWAAGAEPSLEARLSVVMRFAARMRELGPANFLYADGNMLFAHGHRRTQIDGGIAPPGLWRLQRRCAIDADSPWEPGGEVVERTETRIQMLTLVASVPLSDEHWIPFTEGEIIVVKDGEILPARN